MPPTVLLLNILKKTKPIYKKSHETKKEMKKISMITHKLLAIEKPKVLNYALLEE